MTLASFYALIPMLVVNRIVESADELMRVFNRRLYGLGQSENNETYIEDYR